MTTHTMSKVTPPTKVTCELNLIPNLICEIHPMFAYKNWLCLPEKDYDLLKPTLQLATMILNSPACLGFFATLLFGKRTRDEKSMIRIEEESPLTKYKADTIIDMFDDLVGLYKFTFQKIRATGMTIGSTWQDLTDAERDDLLWQREAEKSTPWSVRKSLKHGTTVDKIQGPEREFCWDLLLDDNNYIDWPSADQRPRNHLQDPRTRMTPCTIALSAKLFSDLKAERQSPPQTLKNNFWLASVILHELAHAVECGRPECRELYVEEPTFPGEVCRELGRQLEKFVFGSSACTYPLDSRNYEVVCNCELDGSQLQDKWGRAEWLAFSEWPLRYSSQNYVMPLEYLARIQQQEFWDDAARATDWADRSLLRFPKILPFFKESSDDNNRRHMKGLVMTQGRERAAARYAVYDD